MQKHAPMATRMSPPAYAAMKLRLRSLLQNWGLWTDDELEEVATFVIDAHEAQEKKRKTKKPAQMSDGEMAIWTATFAVEYRRQTLGLEGVSSHVTPSQIVKRAVNLATSAVFAARDAKPAECSLDAAEREFLGDILNPHRQRRLA